MNTNEEKLDAEVEELKQKNLTKSDLLKIIKDDPQRSGLYNKKSIWAFEELDRLKKSEERMAFKELVPWMIAASIPLLALGAIAYELQRDSYQMLLIGMISIYYIWSLDHLFHAEQNYNVSDFSAPSSEEFLGWLYWWWVAPARFAVRFAPAILIAALGFFVAMLVS